MKLLLYCNKQPLFLVRNESDNHYYTMDKGTLNDYKNVETYNGKIVAECDYFVDALVRIGKNDLRFAGLENSEWLNHQYYEYYSCLSEEELFSYVKDKFYAIHIKNLNIFDKPRITQHYFIYQKDKKANYVLHIFNGKFIKFIDIAPQNMMYCYGKNTGEKYVLISIRPEWLCKILNGEKTIEIRKKVLKEML